MTLKPMGPSVKTAGFSHDSRESFRGIVTNMVQANNYHFSKAIYNNIKA